MERFRNILLLIALLGISFTLLAQTPVSNTYKIVNEEGVFVEQFNNFDTRDNRYTEDNIVYTPGVTFTYDYTFIDQKGNEYLHRNLEASNLDPNEAWELVPVSEDDGSAVQSVQMTVLYGLQGLDQMKPDYNRTVVQFDYLTAEGSTNYSEVTGIVENLKNIWMHPPRSKQFRILELNPFPYIQGPYQVGNKWTWSQRIGSFWSDARWAEWDDALENTYQYEITDQRTVNTNFGPLKCYEIKASATNEIGNTALVALFNPDYGFVQMDYTNIDGSQIKMELTQRSVAYATAARD